jgi:excisionase family DNA binding protein
MALPMIGRSKGSKDRSYVFIWPKDSKDNPRTGSDSPVMTVSEVSEYLRIHKATVYKMIKAKQIPYFRIITEYRFNRATIDVWMNRGY